MAQTLHANPPACPVCKTPLEADAPEYLPIVSSPQQPGLPFSLTNARLCICQQCGVLYCVAS
jgi:uncharacterized protein YbaR (Trm112 family)